MSRHLPSLTPLQFLVIGSLLAGEQRGSAVRRELAKHRVRRTAPAFYQMMARIEDAGWVPASTASRGLSTAERALVPHHRRRQAGVDPDARFLRRGRGACGAARNSGRTDD
jgi:hypothetical protein